MSSDGRSANGRDRQESSQCDWSVCDGKPRCPGVCVVLGIGATTALLDGFHVAAALASSERRQMGLDPIFRNNDGSNCEGALPATVDDQRDAYSLLLTRGLIRIGRDVPAGAEFTVDSIADPYACAPGTNHLSVYRRPLPAQLPGRIVMVAPYVV